MTKKVVSPLRYVSKNINFELVYKMRVYNTGSYSNILVGERNKAEAEAKRIHKEYTDALAKELGHNNFDVTHESCLAEGIMHHVYAPSDVPHNIGKRKCVYCGCSDFSD